MKFVPKRMCIVCRNRYEKIFLSRFVRAQENKFVIDEKGKMNGRGLYICHKKECIDKNIKNRLLEKYSKNFKVNK